MKRNILFFIAILSCSYCLAQQPSLHSYARHTNAWVMYTGSHRIGDKWGLHLEGQWRRHDGFRDPQQLLFRTGINYHFNAQLSVTAGYCFVETYPYGDQPVRSAFPENRLWQQIQARTQLQKVEWISRLRMEQRFSKLPVSGTSGYEPGDAVYTNRFRLLNRISVPFKGKTINENSWYATVYDEFMINFGKEVAMNIFDQNRLYVALGYRIPGAGKLEAGYLNQVIQKSDGFRMEMNHTFQLGLFSNIDFIKKQ